MSNTAIEYPRFAIASAGASWRQEREDRGFLMLTRTRFHASRFGTANASLDPRSWLEVRDQGALRAGCGCALATCLEVVHWFKTGRVARLSASFAYISAQKLSGLFGRDAGATLCGTVKAAKVLGACREEILPTTKHYCDTFSLRARRNARRFRVWSHSMLGDYNDAHRFLAAGLGAILLALPWCESFATTDGVIEEEAGAARESHVIAVVGISDCRFDECELAKINRLEAAAWEAWSRSIRDEETTRITVDGEKKKIEKTTQNQTGDTKYLDQIEWCINKRCEILALTSRGAESDSGQIIINVPRERLEKRSDVLFNQELERRGIART